MRNNANMKFINMPDDTFDAIDHIVVANQFVKNWLQWNDDDHCFEDDPSEKHWKDLRKMERGMKVIIMKEEMELLLIPPTVSVNTGNTKRRVIENCVHIWVLWGQSIMMHYDVLEVHAKAGIIIRGNDDIRDYFFPEAKTIKDQLWQLDHQ